MRVPIEDYGLNGAIDIASATYEIVGVPTLRVQNVPAV